MFETVHNGNVQKKKKVQQNMLKRHKENKSVNNKLKLQTPTNMKSSKINQNKNGNNKQKQKRRQQRKNAQQPSQPHSKKKGTFNLQPPTPT